MTRRARRKPDGAPALPATTVQPETHPGDPQDAPLESPVAAGPEPQRRASRRFSVADLGPVLLLRAAHPRQAVATATAVASVAALVGRPARELGLVFATVLVGQAILGWHNDLVDRARDRAHTSAGKPLAQDRLDPGTVWFAVGCAALLVVPLSISNGTTAGSAYLLCLAVGLLGNLVLRKSWLSWLPWAVSFALYPAFVSYGGWGGDALGPPPEVSMSVLAGLLGIGVHFLRALPGLVADHADGLRHLPLRIALRTGATRLLVLSSLYTAGVVVGLLVVGDSVGLSQ